MRDYVSGNWGFRMVWGLTGSVFPRALAMAVPNAILSFIFAHILHGGRLPPEENTDRGDNAIKMLAAFTSVQFFVLFFRSNVAYSRWWEGGTLLQKTRGEWFNAYSSLIAFCSTDPNMAPKVEEFQHLLARLMSLLFCAGLQQVSPNKSKSFEVIDTKGIDPKSLEFLGEAQDKVEVLLQWIQRSTVLNSATGVLPIAPPILSRAFQEISRGIVNLQNARKIADFPFPFPYAQMSMVMLILHYVLTPCLTGMMLESPVAALASFLMVFFLWCINFIALQLEYPFGERDNDLPMNQFQRDWNKSVATLLARRANQPPSFTFDAEYHRQMGLIMSDGTKSKKERVTVIGNVRNSHIFAGKDSVRSKMDIRQGSFLSRGTESLFSSSNVTLPSQKQDSNKSVTLSLDPEVVTEGRPPLRPVERDKVGIEGSVASSVVSLEVDDFGSCGSPGNSPGRSDDPERQLTFNLNSTNDSRSYIPVVARMNSDGKSAKSALKQSEALPQPIHPTQPLQPSGGHLETIALPKPLHLDERDNVSSDTTTVRRLAILRASGSQTRDGTSQARGPGDTDRREADRIIPHDSKNTLSLSTL